MVFGTLGQLNQADSQRIFDLYQFPQSQFFGFGTQRVDKASDLPVTTFLRFQELGGCRSSEPTHSQSSVWHSLTGCTKDWLSFHRPSSRAVKYSFHLAKVPGSSSTECNAPTVVLLSVCLNPANTVMQAYNVTFARSHIT